MKHLFKDLGILKKRLKGREIFLFLDYDGTLTPIVEKPELAVLSLRMKHILKGLAQNKRLHLFIVSGRSMADVKQLVGVDNIVYIGNHGLEIEGANISFDGFSFVRFREILEFLKWEITKELAFFKGALVEDKGLGLSVHYRKLNTKDESIFKTFLEVITKEFFAKNEIQVMSGKKVLEIRPPLDWNKGKAVAWILENHHSVQQKQKSLPVYIGDDTTDEDAFLVLRKRGITICVDRPQHSHARYYLNNTDEVIEFFGTLCEVK
jgi:trehalose-phosphatase